MSTLDGSENTLCPSDRPTAFRLINHPKSHSSEKSSTTKFVQYINSATYIERSLEASDRGFSDEDETHADGTLADVDNINSSYEMSSPRECSSKIRVCKIEEDTEIALQREKRYEEWLRNKRELARKRTLALKASKERKEREMEIQRQMSREKVLDWMSKKSVSSSPKTSERDTGSDAIKTLRVKTKSDDQCNFEAWLKKKEKQELEELERRKRESFYQAQYDLYKKCLSNAFYNKWAYLAREKPRPVPLNQGFASLAGSTTNLYVNPQPWNHI